MLFLFLDRFGVLAAGEVMMCDYGFTVENGYKRAVATVHVRYAVSRPLRFTE